MNLTLPLDCLSRALPYFFLLLHVCIFLLHFVLSVMFLHFSFFSLLFHQNFEPITYKKRWGLGGNKIDCT